MQWLTFLKCLKKENFPIEKPFRNSFLVILKYNRLPQQKRYIITLKKQLFGIIFLKFGKRLMR